MSTRWCRVCNAWHVCDPEDLRKHVVHLDNRAAAAEAAVDYLRELLAQSRPHNCDGLNHAAADQHEGDEPCPILARIDAALGAGHAPDCAIALNGRHECSCTPNGELEARAIASHAPCSCSASISLSAAIDVIENCHGFDEETSKVGEAWVVVKSYLPNTGRKPI